MKQLLYFSGKRIESHRLPAFDLFEKELIRFEFRDVQVYKPVHKILPSLLPEHVIPIEKKGEGSSRKRLVSSWKVHDYINRFSSAHPSEHLGFLSGLNLPHETRMHKLPIGLRNLVYLRVWGESKRVLLIGTAGMSIDALKVTYALLSKYISGGAACLELTYPSFNDASLDELLIVRPKATFAID